MNPTLILALALFVSSVAIALVSGMYTRRIKHLADLALAEQQRLAGEVLDAAHREHRREYAALHRDTHGKIEEQRAGIQELVKHNKRLLTDLAAARIQAIPLHDDPFTLDDRRTLLDALVKLTAARCFYATLNSAEASTLLRIEQALVRVVERVSRHLVADGTLQLNAAAQIERYSNGWWSHPYLPQFAEGLTRERQDAWLTTQKLETQLMWDQRFDEHPDPDPGSDDISGFEPTPPEGNGWFLLSIEQDEDGEARAWYARRLVEVPAATTEAAA